VLKTNSVSFFKHFNKTLCFCNPLQLVEETIPEEVYFVSHFARRHAQAIGLGRFHSVFLMNMSTVSTTHQTLNRASTREGLD